MKRWEAVFREWASEYWPNQPVRSTLQWMRDEMVAGAVFLAQGILKLPWGAIAGFFLILGMVNSYWAMGQVKYQHYARVVTDNGDGSVTQSVAQPIIQFHPRGFDGFSSLTQFGVIRVENYWVLVAAGGILFLAVFRPVFGPRADLLAILLAGYGILHVCLFYNTPPEFITTEIVSGLSPIKPRFITNEMNVARMEYRAAPLVVGITFAVLLLSLLWSMFVRVTAHFQAAPPEDRRFLRSFYESLLGLPPHGN